MSVHHEVLEAARRLGQTRVDWTFTPHEVVTALPHLNASTVRTHVVSRCCVNAPKNHPHKWDYFRRVGRGRYQVLPTYRTRPRVKRLDLDAARSTATRTGETHAAYLTQNDRRSLRTAIHAVVTQEGNVYIAECLELPVVTQGNTLDETLWNLKEAIALHLEGETLAGSGLRQPLRLQVTYDAPLA